MSHLEVLKRENSRNMFISVQRQNNGLVKIRRAFQPRRYPAHVDGSFRYQMDIDNTVTALTITDKRGMEHLLPVANPLRLSEYTV